MYASEILRLGKVQCRYLVNLFLLIPFCTVSSSPTVDNEFLLQGRAWGGEEEEKRIFSSSTWIRQKNPMLEWNKKSGLPNSLEGGLCINEVGYVIVREGRRRTPRCDKLFSQRKEGSKTRIWQISGDVLLILSLSTRALLNKDFPAIFI